MGLPQAFQLAGARNVIASLWAIDDAVTAKFMQAFYQAYHQEGLAPSAALRRARHVIRKLYPDPYYWSAFTMYGK